MVVPSQAEQPGLLVFVSVDIFRHVRNRNDVFLHARLMDCELPQGYSQVPGPAAISNITTTIELSIGAALSGLSRIRRGVWGSPWHALRLSLGMA